jgi:23S rRNA pseudouridine955/2504/2580 synthase
MPLTLIAGAGDDGRRLDRLLRKALPHLPLSLIHRLLRQGRILVDGKPGAGSLVIQPGVVIVVPASSPDDEIPDTGQKSRLRPAARGETAVPLEILWQGTDLLAVNKPSGLVMHGPGGLDGLVREYLADKLPPSLSFTPGPLHRLDQPTSGILMFPVTLKGARLFSGLIRERRITKRYLALAEGTMTAPETWEENLIRDKQRRITLPGIPAGRYTGKPALTRAYPLGSRDGHTLLLLEIGTGRTHQIRAQAAIHGHPLAGDRKYGGRTLRGGLLLHALSLEFPALTPEEQRLYPETAAELAGATLYAPVPGAFLLQIHRFFGDILAKTYNNFANFDILKI